MSRSEYQQLIEFLGGQFSAIDQRFTGIDERFTVIDQRFAAIDQRFAAFDQRFTALDQRFAAIDHRFAALDGRFDALEVAQTAFRGEVLGHFDELYRRLDRLDQEYLAITQTLRRIEGLLADEQTRREVLERTVTELKERVALLQARIDDIERRLRP
jgi:chromosome segregation ATPase